MKLPTSVRYAVRILFTLQTAGATLSIAHISEKTGIAHRAVEKIHAALRNEGITEGLTGIKGGIRLARSLESVSLGNLLNILDHGVDFAVCCGEKSNDCPNQDHCGRRVIWEKISTDFQQSMDQVSLAEFFEKI